MRSGRAVVLMTAAVSVLAGTTAGGKAAGNGVGPRTPDTWSAATPFSAPRAGPAVVGKGLIYAIGGCTDVVCSSTPLGTNTAFNAKKGFWIDEAAMPTPRGRLGAALARDASGTMQIYTLGGAGAGLTPLAANEAYNPASNSWSPAAPLPTPRFDMAVAAASNGLIYTAGGCCGDPTVVEAYNPKTNTWICSKNDTAPGCSTTTLAPLPDGRYAAAAVAKGTLICVIGGISSSTRQPTNTVHVYDAKKNVWSTKSSMPTARYGPSAAFASNGLIFAIGGATSSGVPGANEAYDPRADVWITKTSMPTPRNFLGVAAGSDKRLHALGGDNNGNALAANGAYTP